MKLSSTSPHGHEAIFHSPHAKPSDLSSVVWTSDSIYVPSASPLNAPAEIWFNLSTTPKRASAWCERHNATLLSVHPSNAGFRFRVEGFSRYRYVDSDDEQPARRGVKAEIDDDDDDGAGGDVKPFDPFKSVFEEPPGKDDDAVLRLRSALFDQKFVDDVRMRDSDDDTVPDDSSQTELIDFGSDSELDLRAPAIPVQELPYPVYDNSVMYKREGLFVDAGLVHGRCTRASIMCGKLANARYQPTVSALTTGFGVLVSGMYGDLPEGVADFLRIHCATWLPTREDNGVCMPSLGNSFRDSAVADRTMQLLVEELGNAVEKGDEDARHARTVFWLILALYKGGDAVEVEGDCLIRRLAEWAEGEAGTLFDERPVVTGLRKAVLLLCVGNVEEAVDAAIAAGFVRLAMMISRAVENPKDDLRLDAESQLAVYGFVDIQELEDENVDPERWDRVLVDSKSSTAVSIDERMILLILAGHVGAVARYMGFSWYRLFILELLYGKGSSDLTQPERVAAAVQAIEEGKVDTTAPHATTKDVDVAYHLLRLYADPTSKYPLTSGVYSNSSFGMKHRPLDSRFSWLLYQVLSALIPEAGLKTANLRLSDGLASQLSAGGMPLWGCYVLCCGGVSRDVLRERIMRDWPEMASDRVRVTQGVREAAPVQNNETDGDEVMMGVGVTNVEGQNEDAEDDTLDAERFLTMILRIPQQWIYEAKAMSARTAGDQLEECRCWIRSGSEEGAARAHELLTREVIPEIIVSRDTSKYLAVTNMLKALSSSKHVANWHSSGDLLLSYFTLILGVPETRKLDMHTLRGMAARLPGFVDRADRHILRQAAYIIADDTASAQRAQVLKCSGEERDALVAQLRQDLEKLPCSPGVRRRLQGEYDMEATSKASATRFALALTCYTRFTD